MRNVGGEIGRLDEALASLASEEAALRLRLGQLLEALGRGGAFELGFSSLGAYALERCDRSTRWTEAATCLARRVESLPSLRRAMAIGKVSWSMGELLARVAEPRDETRWLEAAESRTVRQMRALVAAARATGRAAGNATVRSSAGAAEAPAVGSHGCDVGNRRRESSGRADGVDGKHEDHDDDDEMCTIRCTVDQEDAWLFEATRALLEQMGVHGTDAQSEALLAEGEESLVAVLPEGMLNPEGLLHVDAAERRRRAELECHRAEMEACCEERIVGSLLAGREQSQKEYRAALREMHRGGPFLRSAVAAAAARGMASLEGVRGGELDGQVRTLSRALARHELELSRLVLRFHRADGWRRVGYATEAQYARERLGLSRSSLLARRSLGRRLESLPRVEAALGAGQIGVEAALQIVRVATASTEAAWVERAQRRTIKHLREEVTAALVAVRLSGESDCPPPVDDELAAFHELERAVLSGRACRPRPKSDARESKPECRAGAPATDEGGRDTSRMAEPVSEERRAWFVMLGSLARWLAGGLQMSAGAAGSSAGRITLRLRMSRDTSAWWRGLEAQARRWLPRGTSWVRFLCLSMWHAWRHLLGENGAYAPIYVRDRYRCMSPVCSRRDVTPHHLRFRSAGGSDDDDNIASVCTWCHLFGVHGGRIRAVGTARRIRWEIGAASSVCLVVDGRERVAAS